VNSFVQVAGIAVKVKFGVIVPLMKSGDRKEIDIPFDYQECNLDKTPQNVH